jgi:hypothetical protein
MNLERYSQYGLWDSFGFNIMLKIMCTWKYKLKAHFLVESQKTSIEMNTAENWEF